jgi:heme O synthase-like polyprenyltransferase
MLLKTSIFKQLLRHIAIALDQSKRAMIRTVYSPPAALRPERSFALTKPRMASLIVFTTVIGVFLTTPGMMSSRALVFGAIGIALVTGAAMATICLLTKIDALMASTRGCPRGGPAQRISEDLHSSGVLELRGQLPGHKLTGQTSTESEMLA